MEKKRNKMNKETLEEYISEVTKNFGDEMSIKFTSGGIKLGAKWQAERMYSEEEVKNLLINSLHSAELKDNKNYSKIHNSMEEWFEQFKKK
jgi:hypothetical protein